MLKIASQGDNSLVGTLPFRSVFHSTVPNRRKRKWQWVHDWPGTVGNGILKHVFCTFEFLNGSFLYRYLPSSVPTLWEMPDVICNSIWCHLDLTEIPLIPLHYAEFLQLIFQATHLSHQPSASGLMDFFPVKSKIAAIKDRFCFRNFSMANILFSQIIWYICTVNFSELWVPAFQQIISYKSTTKWKEKNTHKD